MFANLKVCNDYIAFFTQIIEQKAYSSNQQGNSGQIPLYFQISIHISLPQCNGSTAQQLLHRNAFFQMNGKGRLPLPNLIFILPESNQKRMFIEPF